jgi:hypothetical protein
MDLTKEIEINYKETNSWRAITNILQANYNLGIIRYQDVFENYFLSLLNEKGLKFETLWEFEYLALMSAKHPLAHKKEITFEMLSYYVEIAHGDPYVPTLPMAEVRKLELSDLITKRIFVYERGSQFDLLCDVPITYIWVSPIPDDLLERYHLVQRRCTETDRKYKDVLIYKDNYRLSSLDKAFVKELKVVQQEISQKEYR